MHEPDLERRQQPAQPERLGLCGHGTLRKGGAERVVGGLADRVRVVDVALGDERYDHEGTMPARGFLADALPRAIEVRGRANPGPDRDPAGRLIAQVRDVQIGVERC